jgi:hypothetical protein
MSSWKIAEQSKASLAKLSLTEARYLRDCPLLGLVPENNNIMSIRAVIWSKMRRVSTDFGIAFRWWMQQSIPVNEAPIKKDASAMATAISAGTPTMTTCEEWRLGDSGSPSPEESSVVVTPIVEDRDEEAAVEKSDVSNSTLSLRSKT